MRVPRELLYVEHMYKYTNLIRIFTTTNDLLRNPYYTINRTTTNRTPITPDGCLEDDSRYSIPASARAKVSGAVQFCNWIGIAILRAEYRMILMSKIIKAISH